MGFDTRLRTRHGGEGGRFGCVWPAAWTQQSHGRQHSSTRFKPPVSLRAPATFFEAITRPDVRRSASNTEKHQTKEGVRVSPTENYVRSLGKALHNATFHFAREKQDITIQTPIHLIPAGRGARQPMQEHKSRPVLSGVPHAFPAPRTSVLRKTTS